MSEFLKTWLDQVVGPDLSSNYWPDNSTEKCIARFHIDLLVSRNIPDGREKLSVKLKQIKLY